MNTSSKIYLALIFVITVWYIIKLKQLDREMSCVTFLEYNKYGKRSFSKIPNVIYTYWNSPNRPPLVEKCINSWRRHNPTYEIIILSQDNIKDYIPFDVNSLRFAKTQQQKADFIRIYLLSVNGGIWLDSSLYLNESLDWIHGYQYNENSEFVGYKLKCIQTTNIPVVENWFLACIPNSKFINDWKDKFYSINNYDTIKQYVNDIKKSTDFQNIKSLTYLTMHIACQYILQKPNTYKISLLEAEKGPFLYNHKINWNLLFLIPSIRHVNKQKCPVIKYRGSERFIIEKLKLYNEMV
jgi:hypothetical protein